MELEGRLMRQCKSCLKDFEDTEDNACFVTCAKCRRPMLPPDEKRKKFDDPPQHRRGRDARFDNDPSLDNAVRFLEDT